MKRLLSLAALLALCCFPAQGQQGNTVTIQFPGVPSGSCGPLQLGLDTANGALYSCNGGTWVAAGGGGTPSVQVAPNQNAIYLSRNCGTQTNCFPVNFDVKACFDGSVVSGTKTITSAGQCQWTAADIGKEVFVTSVCSSTVCGYNNFMTAVTILPTQLAVATITAVNSATSITASLNASATLASYATVLYGTDDTANLNAGWAGAIAIANQTCPTLVLPQGIAFFNASLFTVIPTLSNCTSPSLSTGSKFYNIMQTTGITGPRIMGQGSASTILVPTPDFSYASCTGPNGGGTFCILGWYEPVVTDLGIAGFGQSLLAAGVGSGATLFGGPAGYFHNITLTGWGGRAASLAGWAIGSVTGYAIVSDSFVSGFGGGNGTCLVSGSYNQMTNTTCAFGSQALKVAAGAMLASSNNEFYGPTAFNAAVIDVTGTMESVNDVVQGVVQATAPTPDVKVENGGVLYLTNFNNQDTTVANAAGLSVASGGIAYVSGYHSSILNRTSGGTIAGKLWDLGGNVFGGPLTVTGTIFGSASVTGSPCVAGNLAASAGWGASAAFTAVSGSSQNCQFTLTNTGAGQGASPTITFTYPVAFLTATNLICSATQVGGTQALTATGNFTPTTITATSALFTYNATPTVNLTEIIQVNCNIP